MRPSFPALLISFSILAAAHLLSELYGWREHSFWTKILLMPTLAGWFWFETGQFSAISSKKWIIFGLWLSWLGDCFLLFQKENLGIRWFLLGLGAFLLAHICYLTAFLKFPSITPSSLLRNKWLLLPFLLFLVTMDSFLWPTLNGEMRLPVIFYSITITTMAIGAAWLFGKMEIHAAHIVFLGALFFIGSDSLLAVNKFHTPFPNAGFLIMLTYILGQFGIAYGMWRGLKRIS